MYFHGFIAQSLSFTNNIEEGKTPPSVSEFNQVMAPYPTYTLLYIKKIKSTTMMHIYKPTALTFNSVKTIILNY